VDDKVDAKVVEVVQRILGAVVALGGLVLVVFAVYYGWIAYRWNDNAMWGYFMMAAGGALAVFNGCRKCLCVTIKSTHPEV
jgi:hypothetical protein